MMNRGGKSRKMTQIYLTVQTETVESIWILSFFELV
jgi:hypothetical protein